MSSTEPEIAVDDPTAPAEDSPAVTSTRTVETVVYIVLLGLALLLAFDNWRTGMGWEVGRSAGRLFSILSFYGSRRCQSFRPCRNFLEPRGIRRNLRYPRPASPRNAGFRAHGLVLPVHAMARALCRELRIDCGLHVDGRPHRADGNRWLQASCLRSPCLSHSRSRSTSSCRRGRSKPCSDFSAAGPG